MSKELAVEDENSNAKLQFDYLENTEKVIFYLLTQRMISPMPAEKTTWSIRPRAAE